jgi:hypothetical protein
MHFRQLSIVWLWAGSNFNESWWEFSLSRGNIQSTLFNFHATLVLVWLEHESWENSHANSRFSTLINSHVTLVLVWPGHESWENSHANSRFSTLINSHVTLVLVWPGHESWENSHANSRFSTLINSHATLVLVWPGHESWENSCKLSLLNSHQLSCNSCSRLTGPWELRKLSCKLSLLNSHQLSCNSCSRLTSSVARPSFLGGGEANAEGARPSRGVRGHATSGKFWNLESLKCDFKHFGGEILQNSEDYKVHRRHKYSQTFLIFYSEPYLQLL